MKGNVSATHPDVVMDLPAGKQARVTKDESLHMLGYVLDRRHYQRLEQEDADLAYTLEQAILAGCEAGEIRAWALEREESEDDALWLEQAARYLAVQNGEV